MYRHNGCLDFKSSHHLNLSCDILLGPRMKKAEREARSVFSVQMKLKRLFRDLRRRTTAIPAMEIMAAG